MDCAFFNPMPESIPRRPLGKTGVTVSAIGLGGYHLGNVKTKTEVQRVVNEALDAGIDFFDNAWDYHDGESELRWVRLSRVSVIAPFS